MKIKACDVKTYVKDFGNYIKNISDADLQTMIENMNNIEHKKHCLCNAKGDVRMKIEDYNKYYIQGSDHYLIPKDVFKELFNEMVSWKEESQKQKEMIDKAMDKLYCWGEALDPTFQKDMLDILKEVSE